MCSFIWPGTDKIFFIFEAIKVKEELKVVTLFLISFHIVAAN